ncbi:hypothetical protein HOD29_01195 [archaeon]|jgi:hypothetical protein|nr:hypothetical protein [archaeon]
MIITPKSKEQLEKELGYELSYVTPINTLITKELLKLYPPSKIHKDTKTNDFKTWEDMDATEEIGNIEKMKKILMDSKENQSQLYLRFMNLPSGSTKKDGIVLLDRKIEFYQKNPEKAKELTFSRRLDDSYKYMHSFYTRGTFGKMQRSTLRKGSNPEIFQPIGGAIAAMNGVHGAVPADGLIHWAKDNKIRNQKIIKYKLELELFENNPEYLTWFTEIGLHQDAKKYLDIQKVEAIVGLEKKVQSIPTGVTIFDSELTFNTSAGYPVRKTEDNPLVTKQYAEYESKKIEKSKIKYEAKQERKTARKEKRKKFFFLK